MLPVSSLSRAAYGLRNLLMNKIEDFNSVEYIKIGHPGDTMKELESFGDNCLNLFFYDLNYDGYPSDGSFENPFYVRLFCLITAIGFKTDEIDGATTRSVSKGENELRLIGEVMRILHEQSDLSVDDGKGNEIARLQIVPHTISLDNLNHIWSTQNDTSYRLSVAYEMALAAIPFTLEKQTPPLVGDPNMVTWGALDRPIENENEGMSSLKPGVDYLEIDTEQDGWTPHISLVEKVSDTVNKLHYVFNVQGDLSQNINILVAGKDKAKVKFVWNVWRRKNDNSVVAWENDISDTVVPLEKEIKNTTPPTDPNDYFPNRIDPNNIDQRRVFKVKLPDAVREADTKTWQAIVYATYEMNYEKPVGSGIIKKTLIKSNTVMLYGEG